MRHTVAVVLSILWARAPVASFTLGGFIPSFRSSPPPWFGSTSSAGAAAPDEGCGCRCGSASCGTCAGVAAVIWRTGRLRLSSARRPQQGAMRRRRRVRSRNELSVA